MIATVKFYLTLANATVPQYATDGSSGMDVCAVDDGCVPAHSRVIVNLGFRVELPTPYMEFQIRPRSGIAIKKGITVINTPGTIDSDYRGDVGVILVNNTSEDFYFKRGDRIAQMVLCPIYKCEWDVNYDTQDLGVTDRGAGGFGSTGF